MRERGRDVLRAVALAGALMLCGLASLAGAEHPILAIGAEAPDFSLPGVDGQIHRLEDYASSPILVVVFTCNHCPIAQMYEQRIERLYNDYRDKGVALVAIQPNAPEALRIDELDSSDMSDTLDEMKIRVAFKHLTYPYLYDGETQSVARAYGPQATPHVFVFDKARHLRYEGRVDNSYRVEMVKTQDARTAIDALLAGKPVEVTHTGVFGCSTKWKEKEAGRLEAIRKLEQKPVTLEAATVDDIGKLRANTAKKLTLVSFWSTRCGACAAQFGELENTYRMYSVRDFHLVTVATNSADDRAAVQELLEKQHATSQNLLFADQAGLRRTFGGQWDAAEPYTVLLAPDGRILYHRAGSVDILQLRRTILANMESEYAGFNQYWITGASGGQTTN